MDETGEAEKLGSKTIEEIMDILVRGFRGAERAHIRLDPIALIGGKNFHGKSSICQAVAAALTGATIPFFRSTKPDRALFTKTEAKALVRGGMDKATVVVTSDEGRTTVEWPSHDVKTEGKPPASSKVAAGLINPAEMEDIDRQKFLSALLECEPTYEDVITAGKDANLHRDRCEEISTLIMMQGWDAAYRSEKEKGAKLKGRWEAASGTDFGLKKAEAFLPADWTEDLKGANIAELDEHVATARQNVENAVGAIAVDTADLQRLVAESNAEKQACLAVDQHKPDMEAATTAYRNARATVDAIQIPVILSCPHCKGPLQVSGKEVKAAAVTQVQIDEMQGRKTAAEKLLTEAGLKADIVGQKDKELREAARQHQGASLRYEAAKKKSGSQEGLDIARDLLASLERRQKALRSKAEADLAYRAIVDQVKVVEILAPDGLRRQKLAKALAAFNGKQLAPLCVDAGYPTILLNDSLDLLYGGRPYYLLSESEKWRARAVLQIAVAKLDGSEVVILDGADILDPDGRNGLFEMLAADEDLYYAVAMTLPSEKQMPDLAKAGIGASYWMDSGTTAQEEKKAA